MLNDEHKIDLTLLSVGDFDRSILERLSNGLQKTIPRVKILIAERRIIAPSESFNPKREQYNSTKIVRKIIDRMKDDDRVKILGVTLHDLYVPRLNFVFGERSLFSWESSDRLISQIGTRILPFTT